MLNALKQLFIAFLISLILCPPSLVYANGIQVDSNAAAQNQATMGAAQNGVTVVNIATPNSSGLSHNKFTEFNVGAEGVIINNSTSVGVSQLGGILSPNTNLAGQAASTILNEVTGTGRSHLNGFTEIFGQSANYILANPNGISINGGGFINTPKASLVTGTPEFNGNNLLGLNVSDGDILVHGAGINAKNIDAFELVTRVATINAEIYAKKLNIITGRNLYTPATETTTPLADDGSPLPSVSIDSTALGGMYASRIKLVGTEAGVGVNTQGLVQATNQLEMTADGKIQIKGAVSSGQSLSIESVNNEVAVSGTVNASDTATVSGKTISVAKVGTDDAAVVKASTVSLNAGTFNNDHLIAADNALTVAVDNVINTGTLYSGGSGLFRIGDTLHNNQGTILSQGDMTFEGTADGLKMATLTNDSGVIESLGGGLIFRANSFTNNNSLFTLEEGDEVLSYVEAGYWTGRDRNRRRTDTIFKLYTGRDPMGSPPRTIALINLKQLTAIGLDPARHVHSRQEVIDALAAVDTTLASDPTALTDQEKALVNQVHTKIDAGKLYFGTTEAFTSGYFVAASVTQDTATGLDQGATITAQGDISIEAGTATNKASDITSATGDICIKADTFANVGQEIYKRTTYEWGRGVYHSHKTPHIVPTGGGKETILTPTDYAYASIEAKGKVKIDAGSVTNSGKVEQGIHNPPDPATQAAMVSDITDLTSAIPTNGIYEPNTDPAQNYVIETNPNLTNMGDYWGSDYQISAMGFDPNDEANKRLGDAFYETRLVREQIQALTGGRFLDDSMGSDTDQFKALMDNAIAEQSAMDLEFGVSLTKEQVAALNSDIVWMERQMMDDQEVLVPVVYLCSASLDRIAQGGSVIVGEDVGIVATGDVTNTGLIRSDTDLVVTADNFYNTMGTLSGQDVAVTAKDSIRNIGGSIKGDTVALKAGNDVVTSSAITININEKDSQTQIAKRGNISAGSDLTIEAGGDIGIIGSDVEAGGDTTLKAVGNVAVSSQESVYTNKENGSGYQSTVNTTYQSASTVKTGGNLTIESGKDTSIHGSSVEVGGDVAIKAEGNITVTAAQDSVDYYAHASGGGETDTATVKSQKALASAIKAGGSVTMEAGDDINIYSSTIEAEQNVAVKAEGDLNVTAAQDRYYAKHHETSKGFMGTGSMALDETNTVSTVRSEITAHDKVKLEAKEDVTIQAASITSGDTTEVTAETGQVSMLTSTDSEYEQHVKSKTGFFSWSSRDKGHTDETVQHTEIKAEEGLTITTAEGVVVEYRETGNVQEDIAQLAQAPGLAKMIGFAGNKAVTAAMAAGFNSLVIQAGMQVVGNGGDIGAALEGLASIDTVRSLATAMLTAGLMEGISDTDFMKDLLGPEVEGVDSMNDFIAKLAQELKEGAVQAGINTGVGTAINGGDVGENLVANLRGAAVSAFGETTANAIGTAYAEGDLNYVTHKIAHAALGGALDIAQGGDGVSGAIGGVVGEITGEALASEIEEAMLSGDISPTQAKEWLDAGVDLSKLSAGLAAAVAGADIKTAADAGENAAQNNAIFILAAAVAGLATLSEAQLALLATGTGAVLWQAYKDKIAEGAEDAGASFVAAVKQLYNSLTNEERQELAGTPSSTPTNGVDTNPEGSPSDTVVDNGPTTTPDNSGADESGTVSEDQSGKVDDSGIINVEITIEPKIKKQAAKRGWSENDIAEAITNPQKTVAARDTRWNNDSKTKRDDPATAYFDADGNYVVRNDIDGTIVQISDKNDPDWTIPF